MGILAASRALSVTPSASGTPADGAQTLLHLDGSVVDTGANPKTWTAGSGATPNAAGKFGTCYAFDNSIMYPTANSNAITTPAVADLQFGAGDFTVDCWCYPTAASAGDIMGRGKAVVAGDVAFVFAMRASRAIYLGYQNSVGTDFNTGDTTGLVTLNTWTHVAVVRSGSNIYVFINGVLQITHSIGTITINNPSVPDFAVGGASAGANRASFPGLIDEVRILKGTAVWTSNFTPPSAPYA